MDRKLILLKANKTFRISFAVISIFSSAYLFHKYMCKFYPETARKLYFDKIFNNNEGNQTMMDKMV
jgi:hypothetical protein